jgi:hypothetical protein
MKRMLLVLVLLVGVGSTADAQLHGMGRIQGTVADEGGTPLADVAVRATLPGSAGEITGTSDAKGRWIIGGMARGDWEVVFSKPGFQPRKAVVHLKVELARIPAIEVALQKAS